MTNEERELLDRWILTFLEPPPVVDPELMRRLLAEHDATQAERPMTDKTFKAGDKVRWDHSQGTTTGEVVRKITRPTMIKGHRAAASKDDPEYIVESGKTGARAAHRPDQLRKA